MAETDWPLVVLMVITISILLFCGRHYVKADKLIRQYRAERDASDKECERWKKRYYVLKDGKY